MSRNTKPTRKRKKSFIKKKPDKIILYFAIFMALFGAIMIFDASVYQATIVFNDQFYFLKQQLVWLIVGSIPAIIAYFWDYKKLLKLSI